MMTDVDIIGAFPNAAYHSNTPIGDTQGGGVMHVDWVTVYNT